MEGVEKEEEMQNDLTCNFHVEESNLFFSSQYSLPL